MLNPTLLIRVIYNLLLLLLISVQITTSLKCYSGDPAFKNECTSLSYCIFIVSRNGRTQWSCDGNAMSQVSLCSTLGLQHDVEEETNSNFPTFVNQAYRGKNQDNKLVRTPYESSAVSSNNRFYPSRSLGSSRDTGQRRFGIYPQSSGYRCFNGGDLGQICCCSADYCNQSVRSLKSNFWIVTFLSFCLLWRRR